MRSGSDQIERIRDASNIVDVVSEYIRLRKRGRSYIGLCPFHDEKTPSFNVVEDKGIFKCFGCGEAGDVFTFVMKMDGLAFPEALEKLAERAGIEYVNGERRSDDTREPLFGCCKEFASFCYRKLRASSNADILSYLHARGFTDDVLHRFGVGFSPEGKESFYHAINDDRFGAYIDAGIIAKGENGYYERFHGRIIFPIYDATGRVIAFGGRAMPDVLERTKTAKYINSPETPIYHKSKVLYGLFQAKDAIRKSGFAILVEGYADVIAMHQHGLAMTVAASGTSLTTEQLHLLRRYTTNVALLFDSDAAGDRAAVRGIELALAAGFDVSIITLPSGDDPDTFLKREGQESFERLLSSRTSFVDVLAEILRKRTDTDSPEGKAKAVRRLVEIVSNADDPIKRELLVRRIAAKFALSESMLVAELNKKSVPQKPKRQEYKAQEQESKIVRSDPSKAELSVLYCFLRDTRVSLDEMIASGFDIDIIENDLVSTIIAYCSTHYEHEGRQVEPSEIIEAYRDNDAVVDLVTKAVIERAQVSANWDEVESSNEENIRARLRHSMSLLTASVLEKHRAELAEKLKSEPSFDKQSALLTEIADCSKKITELKSFVAVS